MRNILQLGSWSLECLFYCVPTFWVIRSFYVFLEGNLGRILNSLCGKIKHGSLCGNGIRSFRDIWTWCSRTWLSRNLSLTWAASVALKMQFSTFQVQVDLSEKWLWKERCSAVMLAKSSSILRHFENWRVIYSMVQKENIPCKESARIKFSRLTIITLEGLGIVLSLLQPVQIQQGWGYVPLYD